MQSVYISQLHGTAWGMRSSEEGNGDLRLRRQGCAPASEVHQLMSDGEFLAWDGDGPLLSTVTVREHLISEASKITLKLLSLQRARPRSKHIRKTGENFA